jgi:hypothetical protein
MREIIAPVKNAAYIPNKILGHPKKSPIKSAYFTSPKPMPRPFVTAKRKKKKRKEIPAERIEETRIDWCMKTVKKNVIKIAGKSTLSGIIPFCKSIKKITSKEERM